MADWLAEVRARLEAAAPAPWRMEWHDDDPGDSHWRVAYPIEVGSLEMRQASADFTVHARNEDVPRLLACAEALAELVALHEGSQTQRPSRWETAWERARPALEGGE